MDYSFSMNIISICSLSSQRRASSMRPDKLLRRLMLVRTLPLRRRSSRTPVRAEHELAVRGRGRRILRRRRSSRRPPTALAAERPHTSQDGGHGSRPCTPLVPDPRQLGGLQPDASVLLHPAGGATPVSPRLPVPAARQPAHQQRPVAAGTHRCPRQDLPVPRLQLHAQGLRQCPDPGPPPPAGGGCPTPCRTPTTPSTSMPASRSPSSSR